MLKDKKYTIRERHKEITINQVKKAARDIFYGEGRSFDEVSVEEIAASAGVSRGTLYLHFENKNDILWSIIEDDLNSYLELYDELSRLNLVDMESIRKWVDNYYRHFDHRRKSLELFPRVMNNSRISRIIAHHDEIMEKLGERFECFRLNGIDPSLATRRRASGHMLLYQIDQVVIYFSAINGAPDINVGLDLLAEKIFEFINDAE